MYFERVAGIRENKIKKLGNEEIIKNINYSIILMGIIPRENNQGKEDNRAKGEKIESGRKKPKNKEKDEGEKN